jgi:hypothetical protein
VASFYVSPLGSGTKNGSSVANAAAISQLPDAVQKVGAGGSILLLADQGSYSLASPLILRAGGTASAPISIKGVDIQGNSMDAQFIGTRAQDWSSGAAEGQDAIRLMSDANNLSFENLSFKDVANAFRVGADISNLSISHASAQNVAHFLEDYASGSNKTATISGLVVNDVTVSGYSKSVVRLQYDTHDVAIRDTIGDSKGIDGGFAVGVHLHGTVHGVLLSHVTMQNNVYTGTDYWNGDGFATEADVYNVRFDHTVASGNADAGYDIKSASTVLDGVIAEGNNRNFRFWNTDTVVTNSTGIDPHHRGGTASEAQIHLADNAIVTVIDSSFTGSNAGTAVFNLDQSHATLTLENVSVSMDDGAKISRLFDGSVIKGSPILGAASPVTLLPTGTALPPTPVFVAAAGLEAGISDGHGGTASASLNITVQRPVSEQLNEVYRFYDTVTSDHFYTTNIAEKNNILANNPAYHYEGVPWATPDQSPGTIDVFRFFDTVHGDHFFTTSTSERDSIIRNIPSYNYEGVAFQAYANAGAAGGVTLGRFYNTQTGLHHYSANADETFGINHGAAGANWVDEGPGFNVHLPPEGMLTA